MSITEDNALNNAGFNDMIITILPNVCFMIFEDVVLRHP